MTRKVRTLTVCVAALFALGALTATAASAKSTLPEWGGCEVFLGAPATETEPARGPGEGRYGNSTCTDPVKPFFGKPHGEYEWYPFESFLKLTEEGTYNFEGGAIGPTTFETTTGKSIKCSEGFIGQLAPKNAKEVGEILTYFLGCVDEEGQSCRGTLNGYREISDEEEWGNGEGLKGELVYLAGKSTATPTVGLTLTAFKSGGPLFTVACDGTLGTVQIGGAGGKKTEKSKGNAVVSVITPVDEMVGEGEPSGSFTQTFTQTNGVQEPAPEKGKALSLQAYLANENKWFQLGMDSSFQDLPEGGRPPIEIKAIK